MLFQILFSILKRFFVSFLSKYQTTRLQIKSDFVLLKKKIKPVGHRVTRIKAIWSTNNCFAEIKNSPIICSSHDRTMIDWFKYHMVTNFIFIFHFFFPFNSANSSFVTDNKKKLKSQQKEFFIEKIWKKQKNKKKYWTIQSMQLFASIVRDYFNGPGFQLWIQLWSLFTMISTSIQMHCGLVTARGWLYVAA